MLIAIDICNTLADIKMEIEKVLGLNPSPSLYHHPLADKRFFENNLWIFDQARPFEYSAKNLNYLCAGNKLVYITARPVISMIITISWLKRHGYPEGEVIFTSDKASFAKKLGVNLAIDDSPYEISNYLQGGIGVLVKAQPYNTQFKNRFEWFELVKMFA